MKIELASIRNKHDFCELTWLWKAEGNRWDELRVTIGSRGEHSVTASVYHNHETHRRLTMDLERFFRSLAGYPPDFCGSVRDRVASVADSNDQLRVEPSVANNGEAEIEFYLAACTDDPPWAMSVNLVIKRETLLDCAKKIATVLPLRPPDA